MMIGFQLNQIQMWKCTFVLGLWLSSVCGLALGDDIPLPQVDSKEIYLRCRGDQNLKNEKEWRECFEKIQSDGYTQAADDTYSYYKNLFSGFEEKVEAAANTRWNQCKTISEQEKFSPGNPRLATARSTGILDGMEQYHLSSGLFFCIDSNVNHDLDSVSDEIAGIKFSITEPVTQRYIRGMFFPRFQEVIKAHIDREITEENNQRERLKAVIKEKISRAILIEPSWAEGLSNLETGTDAVKKKCIPLALSGFTQYFRKVGQGQIDPDQLPTRIVSARYIAESWSAEICENLAPLLSEWIASLKPLEEQLYLMADREVERCQGFMGHVGNSTRSGCPPSTGYLICLNRMRGCVMGKWAMLEEEAVRVWSVGRFKSGDPELFKSVAIRYLEKNRSQFQRKYMDTIDDRKKDKNKF